MATGIKQKNMVLLWTNPNPSVAFAAQDILLDLSEYSMIMVVYRHWNNDASTSSTIIPVGEKAYLTTFNQYITLRGCETSTSKVYFGIGYYSPSYGNNTNTNDACIPYKIWGIKA